MEAATHRCWAEVDLPAILHNLEVARGRIGPGAGVMAIIKANAYGHGLAEVARALRGRAAMLGVASLAEAQAVHAALGPEAGGPGIFILGPALPDERPAIVAGGFIPAVSTLKEAAAYSAQAQGRRMRLHVAIDTGMGRMGVAGEDALEILREMARMADIEIAGIATHLPVADEDERYTQEQLNRFEGLLAALRADGIDAPSIHCLNSAGILKFPGHAGTLVRAGLMLYGSSPLPEFQGELRPALAWKTRITLIREVAGGQGISYGRTFKTPGPMRVATLAVGYADGYQRHLSGRQAEVLIQGRRCPVLGRITMDQIMVDVTQAAEAAIGDEAILIGKSGPEEILAAELAEKSGTIAWEIFTGIGPRVERLYGEGAAAHPPI